VLLAATVIGRTLTMTPASGDDAGKPAGAAGGLVARGSLVCTGAQAATPSVSTGSPTRIGILITRSTQYRVKILLETA
jgi:hypothetical protein